MGYVAHNTIIVTSWDGKRIAAAHEEAIKIFEGGKKALFEFKGHVSEITPEGTNGYASFFVAPDGSKEGWPESDEGNRRRDEFTNWLNTQRHEDGSSNLEWVEVRYSSDDRKSKIVRDVWTERSPAR